MNELFHDALAVPAERRGSFVAQSCGDDPAMAGEIAQLLAAHERDQGIMEGPAVVTAPGWLEEESPSVVGGGSAPTWWFASWPRRHGRGLPRASGSTARSTSGSRSS